MSTTTDDLTSHLLATGPDLSSDDERERWVCDDDDKAGWALRKLAAAEAERERIKRLAQAEIARIEAWATDADRQVARDVDFFTSQLIGYRRRLEASDPKLPKTYKLPAGSIARRAGRTSVKVVDERAFVEWAYEAKPDALTMRPKVSALADYPDTSGYIVDPDTGEQVPGVERVRGDDHYEVKSVQIHGEAS